MHNNFDGKGKVVF